MVPTHSRRAALFIGLGVAALLGIAGLAFKLVREVRRSLAAPLGSTAPLSFLPLPEPAVRVDRWGGGEVRGVAVTPDALLTAGTFGVRNAQGDLGRSLPTLRATALALWRGTPVVALEEGGVFLRRNGAWEAFRTGFGTLHVRSLMENPGGELFLGAREGLFRTAWGANTLDRLDAAPVQALALAPDGSVVEGGETGLSRWSAGRMQALASPDPWIQWVGLAGHDLLVLTPLGLARGPLGGALTPVPGADGVESAASAADGVYAVEAGRLLRLDAAGHPTELFLPAQARRLLVSAGELFVDTDAGLYHRAQGAWALVQPRPEALPPGSSAVGALARYQNRIAVGLFDGGLVLGSPTDGWRAVPGAAAWGVNALMPSGGILYVASLRGVSRFDGARLAPVAGEEGAAFSLTESPAGPVFGTGQGVALPDGAFLSAFHGLPGNQALALAMDPSGLLFVGTPSGLGAVRGARVLWRLTSGDGKLPHPWVTALARFGDALYLGTYGGGLAKRLAPATQGDAVGAFVPFVETEGMKVSANGLVAAGGTLFAGTDGQGLLRLSPDGSRFLPVKVPLPSPHITAILPAPEGLYVGTDEGLARIPLPLSGEGL